MQSSRNVYFGENEALQLDGSGLTQKISGIKQQQSSCVR